MMVTRVSRDEQRCSAFTGAWPCHLRKEVLLITAVRGRMIHDHALDDDHPAHSTDAVMILMMGADQ